MTVRRAIRIKAFQALFQLANNYKTTSEDAINDAIRFSLDEEQEQEDFEIFEAFKQALPIEKPSEQLVQDSLDYLKDLVTGVKENEKFLDEEITKTLKNWTLQRIELTNLLILRIAAYELHFHEEIDPSIVMNEAIELTKSFNNENASKFVNGVLQGILDAKEA